MTVADATSSGGLTFVSNAGDCTTAFPCALGTVPAGATRTITTTFSVPVGYAGPSPIANVAAVSATTPDPDASDNTATAQTTVNRAPTCGVVKSVSPATVLVGEQATFTVTVSNAGPARALGLVVRDLLPVGLTLDSFSVSQGSYVPATGDWTVGAVDAGQSATLTLVATLEVTGVVTNLATITATDQPDPDTSNDSAAVEVNGQPAADIAVTKTVDNATPAVGTHGHVHGDGDEPGADRGHRRGRHRRPPRGADAGVGDAVAGHLHRPGLDRRRAGRGRLGDARHRRDRGRARRAGQQGREDAAGGSGPEPPRTTAPA